jgi:DNA mismatch endonuclease (patch repair protein)
VPETRREFWLKKISRNVERDKQVLDMLKHDGWRVLIIWECALRGTRRLNLEKVLNKAQSFLSRDRNMAQVRGGRGSQEGGPQTA